MLGNVLNGEISNTVFALRDHRLETTWKGQLAVRSHTINYKLIFAIQIYIRLSCSWMPNSVNSARSLVTRCQNDPGLFLTLSTITAIQQMIIQPVIL